MADCGSAVNIRIEPVDVTWEIEEQWCIQTVADVSESLDAKYFTMDTASTGYYVWMDIGAAADPAPSGRTGIAVTASANDTADAIATAIATAVDANAAFAATATDDCVTITHVVEGDVTSTSDVDTGFTFTQLQAGGELDLGLLQGDIEVSFTETTFEVTAHQTGITPLADLRQGVTAEVSLTLQESDTTKLKEMFAKAAGGTYTPSGGTELYGWGTSRQGLNTIVQARRLIFHPVALASSDLSRDLCFWKAYPLPDSLVYSGENPQTLSVTFKVYRDESKDSNISLFSFGDHTQLDPT